MVCEFGMSSLGPLTYGRRDEQIFLGKELVRHQDYSEDTALRIDAEVKRIVLQQYERARALILENRDGLDRLALALLERETLDGLQVRRVIAGLPLDDESPSAPPSGSIESKPKTQSEPSVLNPMIPPVRGENTAPA
jgi:cell division protease FtsH